MKYICEACFSIETYFHAFVDDHTSVYTHTCVVFFFFFAYMCLHTCMWEPACMTLCMWVRYIACA